MQTHHSIESLQTILKQQGQLGKTIGLVPTMGNLHAGHLSLIDEAKKHCDYVVASIFVNPMQFDRREDLDSYPRTLSADIAKLETAACDALFAPSAAEMYPQGLSSQTVVSVPELSKRHCGAARPGHFDGVATVVSKLFNIVRPDMAVFGLKDFQQYLIICKMVRDLCFPIKIIGLETLRESSGLAMSSRNGALNNQQKHDAAALHQHLKHVQSGIVTGATNFADLEREAVQDLNQAGIQVEYFSICNAESLEPAGSEDTDLVILAAAWMGKTRLIDNIRCTRTRTRKP
jgi:pantoate--beta-alanine ligase